MKIRKRKSIKKGKREKEAKKIPMRTDGWEKNDIEQQRKN